MRADRATQQSVAIGLLGDCSRADRARRTGFVVDDHRLPSAGDVLARSWSNDVGGAARRTEHVVIDLSAMPAHRQTMACSERGGSDQASEVRRCIGVLLELGKRCNNQWISVGRCFAGLEKSKSQPSLACVTCLRYSVPKPRV
jgi:hypothetical protein